MLLNAKQPSTRLIFAIPENTARSAPNLFCVEQFPLSRYIMDVDERFGVIKLGRY